MQAPIGEEERQLWNYDLGLRWEGHWGFKKPKKVTLQILQLLSQPLEDWEMCLWVNSFSIA